MLELNSMGLRDTEAWKKAGIELPQYDHEKMAADTRENPQWVHFGAGNIFRGFVAALQQEILNLGKANTGIVAVETFDTEIIDKIYKPHDNLSLLVIMKPDGSLENKVIASIGEGLVGDTSREKDWKRLQKIFLNPGLQVVSFTMTEKGYNLRKITGEFMDVVQADMKNGPENPVHAMSKVAALAYLRFKNGGMPIAFVSMDNCAHNGEKLQLGVETIVEKWIENGFIEKECMSYIKDETKVSFPWTMIDKITPRPADSVKIKLNKIGIDNIDSVITSKNTFIAPFVNAEVPQYLVIEDKFPNGRMPLELAGVKFTDRITVDKVEKMKVCTCLNPLQTALAVFGCLLGYVSIADEMQDPHLNKLVGNIGYDEGLPVVVKQDVLNPKEFIKEVIEERLTNPYIPDTPQRIASDTSLKVGIRFGETIKAYRDRPDLDPSQLVYIPITIAGWCRYLLGIDDKGDEMPLSPDPMSGELQSYLKSTKIGDGGKSSEVLKPILSNEEIFGLNLYEVGLGKKIEDYFQEMITEKGSVRKTLGKYLS